MSFAKLFSSITESSLWSEGKETRLMFVTMLAKADSVGFVEAALPGLARAANLTMEEASDAIATLEAPDPHSKDMERAPDNEGRRILKVSGGWMVVNYEDYRARRSDEERREYMREYMKQYRKQRKQVVKQVNRGEPPLAQAETETETETETDDVSSTPCSQSSKLPSTQQNGRSMESKAAEIYHAYPVKKGKKRALDAITKALKAGADHEEILGAVRKFAKADCPKPHASTYFHQERWADEHNGEDYKAEISQKKDRNQVTRHIPERRERRMDLSKPWEPGK